MKMTNKKKIVKAMYFSISIILGILIAIVFSNFSWFQKQMGNIPQFSYGPVKPYTESEEQQRFALNELNQKFTYMIMSISALSDNFTVDVHYQVAGSPEYHAVTVTREDSDGITSRYSFLSGDKVQNLYIDLNGTFQQMPTISVATREITFGITPVACVFGICFVLLMFTIFHLRSFFIDIYHNKEILRMLVMNDIKARYAGSFFGIMWSFVQPILTILVFWFVFQLGFKNPPVQNIPYILWFIPAYIPWMYFQDVVINATGCLREYSYLVKKMKFKVSILPVIKVISSFIIHLCFILFMFFAYGVYGIVPSWMALQLLYYSFAMVFMVCGLSWLIAALSVFMKDFAQIIGIILQLGYFAIPIFWTEEMMSPAVLTILKLNPIYYIVQGYRDCMSGNTFFWEYPWLTVYFWVFSIIVFLSGITLFEKVKKHFADLL